MVDTTEGTTAERERLAQRIRTLSAEDPQFRASFPSPEVVEAKLQPGLSLAEVVKVVMEGYAERPALGQRARELVTDPVTGRTSMKLLPRFDTISYGDLWSAACAVARDWHHDQQHPLAAGEFVCILGFASIGYATNILASIHSGAVIVPLQTSAPASQHAAIMAETEPRVLAVAIDYLDAAVEAVQLGYTPQRLVVFDYEARDDDQAEKLAAARQRLADAGCPIVVETLDTLIDRGRTLPPAPLFVPAAGDDPLSWLFYTSGSTGTPKGAMFPQSLTVKTWRVNMPIPAITLSFMPMSHMVGNGYMLLALANGGTSYCAPKSDLSTLFEDLPLARPTMTSLVPRVCEMFYQEYLREVDKRVAGGAEQAEAEREAKRQMRETLLGNRLLNVGCGSAALAPEIYQFMLEMLDMHMSIGYSSTEIGGNVVWVDGKVQRPPVIDYKLVDVPELGYFTTDKPWPRGELLVKSTEFMAGYYKRPELTAERFDAEGYYRTGDVMAETAPDQLQFVDRCNNVIKLSQGEFVAVSQLEAGYTQSPLIRQIYIYGTSERSYLLAVIVPTAEGLSLLQGEQTDQLKAALRQSMQRIAAEKHLNGYEMPRDFIIELEPFSHANGLLSEVGKHLRPMLKARYGETLEQMYAQMAAEQVNELRALRLEGADKPVLETVTRALCATLGITAEEVTAESRFGDLGGDSLSALQFSVLLEEIFGIEVPVGDIINPAGNLRSVANYIETLRDSDIKRATVNSVHGKGCAQLSASDFKLEKFIDQGVLDAAANLPVAAGEVQTVLLTGATGYLGRFLALAWLEHFAKAGGKLILIARGRDSDDARRRVEAALDSDPALLEHFRSLAADHLEVVAGDLGAINLGLDEATWSRLADSVGLIVHSGAHVNHVLPYNQLFPANVAGTAELIRLAITAKRKRFNYISTLGVSVICSKGLVTEEGDIRAQAPQASMEGHYAHGYNLSKWGSEVLLREAFEAFDLPVSVFRPGMILAHSTYAGQLNVPDMFTRLLFSLVATGVAPDTFYAEDLSAGRPAGRYEGFSADFLANAITAIGLNDAEGFHAYNLSSPYEDGVSLDSFVDWLIDAGCPIQRVASYSEWLAHFETSMHALSETKKQQSLLALLDPYRQPQPAGAASQLQSDHFCAAAKRAGFEVPHLSAALIEKYVADLHHLQLL